MAISSSSTFHPLDPLSGDEMLAASELIRATFKGKHPGAPLEALIFNVVTLDEPSKSELLAFDAGKGPLPARKSFSILQPPLSVYGENETYAIVEYTIQIAHPQSHLFRYLHPSPRSLDSRTSSASSSHNVRPSSSACS